MYITDKKAKKKHTSMKNKSKQSNVKCHRKFCEISLMFY